MKSWVYKKHSDVQTVSISYIHEIKCGGTTMFLKLRMHLSIPLCLNTRNLAMFESYKRKVTFHVLLPIFVNKFSLVPSKFKLFSYMVYSKLSRFPNSLFQLQVCLYSHCSCQPNCSYFVVNYILRIKGRYAKLCICSCSFL